MNRKIALLAIASVVLLFASCNKRCHCYDRNGANVYYTPAEVDSRGTTCSNMVSQAGKAEYYYLCEWEY